MTSTGIFTNSVASAGSFSYRSSAHRYSICTFRCSVKPASLRPASITASVPAYRFAVALPKTPRIGIRAASAPFKAKHAPAHAPRARRSRRLLLRAHDAACGGGELLITQEHLAHMLGAQRASVSLFASQLQEEGLIQYRRGRVQIRDMDRLRAHACDCYMAVRRHYERLFARDEDRADILSNTRGTVKKTSLRSERV